MAPLTSLMVTDCLSTDVCCDHSQDDPWGALWEAGYILDLSFLVCHFPSFSLCPFSCLQPSYSHSSPWPCLWKTFLIYPLIFAIFVSLSSPYRGNSLCIDHSWVREELFCYLKSLAWCLPWAFLKFIFNMSYFFVASWKGSKSPLPWWSLIVLLSSCSSRNLHMLYLILPSFQDFENTILIRE